MTELLIPIVFAGSGLLSYFLNAVLVKYSSHFGNSVKAEEDVIRWASKSKPTVGGISFFLTFVLVSLVFFVWFGTSEEFSLDYLGLVSTVTIGFLLGLQDDAYSTRPLIKLGGQVLCGVIMIAFGISIDLFHIPVLDYLLTVFWVVGIMNAVNLLDNMDGVTGTVSFSIIATTVVLIHLFSVGYDPFFYSLIAMGGALAGFLVLNWKPSKLYMGDTGSQFLGAFLAYIGARYLWNIGTVSGQTGVTSMQVIVPLMAFIVPIMDTSFVTIFRMMRGQSPFVGGRDHLTHHLTYVGVSESLVPLVLGLVTLISGVLVLFTVKAIPQWNHGYTTIFLGYIAATGTVFAALYKRGQRISRIREQWARRAREIQKTEEKLRQISEKQQVN